MSQEGDSMEKLKGLQITSLDDDDDEEEEEEVEEFAMDEKDDDDDDKAEEEEEEEFVTLCFVEKPKNPWSLLSQLFPNKARSVPVYASIEKEYTFHRMLFVFMCSSMNCLLRDQHEQWKRHPEKRSRSVKIFRCQLPRFNPFYPSEPPRCDGTDKPSGTGAALGTWLGTWKGDKLCSSCRTALASKTLWP
ncbi:hypothetical protein CFP56_039640 [Quercus suber]|uniref:Uncharacterized protein n=1 Tax=Quercus suber TaxID=58331 RepID=A0AAW0M8M4_QUESU